MAANGVVYSGVRIESIPHVELAQGWAGDALKDPVIMAGLVKALDRANEKDIREVRLLGGRPLSGSLDPSRKFAASGRPADWFGRSPGMNARKPKR